MERKYDLLIHAEVPWPYNGLIRTVAVPAFIRSCWNSPATVLYNIGTAVGRIVYGSHISVLTSHYKSKANQID
jgi:hypothetical protein